MLLLLGSTSVQACHPTFDMLLLRLCKISIEAILREHHDTLVCTPSSSPRFSPTIQARGGTADRQAA